MKKDEFEDIFKDSFENFEAEVRPDVWKNVQTAIKGAGIGLLGKAILNKIGANTLIAVVSSAAAVVGTVVVMNWGTKPETKPVAATPPEPKVKIENPKPAKVEEIKDFLSNSPVVKTEAPAETKKPVKEENQSANETLVIKKDKINEVISEYSKTMVASITASPIAGTVPLVVNLSNNGVGKINRWNFGDGQKESNTVNPVHVYDTPGLYTIMLTSVGQDGKAFVDSVKIEVTGNSSLASVATSFSPNGDGDKDFFVFEKKNIINMTAIIVDEKGKTVYIWDEGHTKWDGKDLKGKPAKEGVYFYIQTAEGVDGKKYEQKGSIRLTR